MECADRVTEVKYAVDPAHRGTEAMVAYHMHADGHMHITDVVVYQEVSDASHAE